MKSILYKRTKSGKVQTWQIFVDGNTFYTEEGILDGKITRSKPTTCKPKNVGRANEVSAEQQAKVEAEAKYKKKLKSNYHESVEDVDEEQFFEPMLAKEFVKYEKTIHWTEGVGVQIKFNGHRIIAKKSGLFTRKGEKYTCLVHIEEALKPFFAKYPKAVLDGEGFNEGLREKLNEISKLLRKSVNATPEDIAKSKELIRFNIYDGFGFGAEESEGYVTRKKAIDDYFGKLYGEGVFDEVKTVYVSSKAELEKLYQQFLADKHEGAILRIINQPYQRKRSKYLLKYKPVDDAEFKILDVEEGEGNRAGMAGKVVCEMENGEVFRASMKGNETQFAEVLKNKKKYIGKTVTIYYNGLTGKGIPNFARFDCNNWDKGH